MPWPVCSFGGHQVKKGRVRTIESGLKKKIEEVYGGTVDEGGTICSAHWRSLYAEHGVRPSAAAHQGPLRASECPPVWPARVRPARWWAAALCLARWLTGDPT